MKNKFYNGTMWIIAVFLLVLPALVWATNTAPSISLWYTPTDATAADEIQLSALVFNDSAEEVTTSVQFSANQAIIAPAMNVVIAAHTAKVATLSFTMPGQKTIITAIVPTAFFTKSKKSDEALLGATSSLIVADTTLPVKFPAATGLIGAVVDKLESFRTRELTYFTALKETNTLGSSTPKVIGTVIEISSSDSKQSPMRMFVYAYAAAGKALFAQKALFYIVLVLLLLFILRFLFSFIL